MHTNEPARVAASIQRRVMGAPTATIEQAVAEARRREHARVDWVADRAAWRTVLGTANAA